jgi:hypothetical protein
VDHLLSKIAQVAIKIIFLVEQTMEKVSANSIVALHISRIIYLSLMTEGKEKVWYGVLEQEDPKFCTSSATKWLKNAIASSHRRVWYNPFIWEDCITLRVNVDASKVVSPKDTNLLRKLQALLLVRVNFARFRPSILCCNAGFYSQKASEWSNEQVDNHQIDRPSRHLTINITINDIFTGLVVICRPLNW